MKLVVDTADTAEIKSLACGGRLDGVPPNPSVVAKTGKQFTDVVREICAVVRRPVGAEVAATDPDGMLREAIAGNVAVKLPLTSDGLLSLEVNGTLPVAALPAAVRRSPFHHPLTDPGVAGFAADRGKTGQTIA